MQMQNIMKMNSQYTKYSVQKIRLITETCENHQYINRMIFDKHSTEQYYTNTEELRIIPTGRGVLTMGLSLIALDSKPMIKNKVSVQMAFGSTYYSELNY